MATPVLLFEHPVCQLHDPGAAHPERPERVTALLDALARDDQLSRLVERRLASAATEEDLLRVHTASLIDDVRRASRRAAEDGAVVWVDEDTAVSALSWDAALASAGCAISAVDAVLDGRGRAAFALSRPPGHHASANRAMGFCLFNNVAVAVRRAQARGSAQRVLVVDWDAHHGNGTQDVFYDDASVYVLSMHLSPHFPETGSAAERGVGRAKGTTRNVPLPPGTTGAEYRERFLEALDDALRSFEPDLVVASIGFDCLDGDPEGGLRLEPGDLHRLASDLVARLPQPASRRVVGVLEGGYRLEHIGAGFVQVLRALAGLTQEKSDATRSSR